MVTRILILLFVVGNASISLFAQKPVGEKTENEVKIERQLKILNDSVLRANSRLVELVKAMGNRSDERLKIKTDSLTKLITQLQTGLGENRLKKLLETAEKTLQFQNLAIQVFGVIYALIAIAAGLLYFFSLKPLIDRAERSVDRTNQARERLDVRIDNLTQQAAHSMERTDSATQKLDSSITKSRQKQFFFPKCLP